MAPITQIPPIHNPQVQMPLMPQYNAVKIDIHNPQVNSPGYTQNPIAPNYTAPLYNYPQAPIYEMPQKSVYEAPRPEGEQAPAVEKKEIPAVPAPVVVAPETTVATPPSAIEAPTEAPIAAPVQAVDQTPAVAPQVVAEVEKEQPKEEVKVADQTPAPASTAPAQTVEVKEPVAVKPSIDINEFINKLTCSDYEVQAKTMASIAEMTKAAPQDATTLLDVRVIDTLLGVINKDTSTLPGPTAQQLQIRESIIAGKKVTEAEMAEANNITPMELAERNKQFAIYTTAALQNLYISEIQKMNNATVPLTELPGAAGIVEQVKNNPNPMVRSAGIDALSFIERPEYKQDLSVIFALAKNDQNPLVQKAATIALEKLAKVAEPQVQAQPTA